jgi:hypothetical protein
VSDFGVFWLGVGDWIGVKREEKRESVCGCARN